MHNILRILTVIATSVVIMQCNTVAGAQTPPASPACRVTLDSCRHMALRYNKQVQLTRSGIDQAKYMHEAAKSAYLPSVDFGFTYMLSSQQINLLKNDAMLPTLTFDPATQSYKPNVVVGADGKPVIDPKTGNPVFTEVAMIPKEAMSYNTHQVMGGAFTITQPVYMGGEIRAMDRITGYARELAQHQHDLACQEVVYRVDEAYWQVVSLEHKKQLAQGFVNLMDTLMYDVTKMYEAGVATRSDTLRVRVQVNEAQIALTKVENGLSLSRMALAQICGLPVDTDMRPADKGLGEEPAAAPPVSYNITDVYASRPELASLRTGVNIFREKENVAMSAMLPKVALVGAYSFSNPNMNNGFHRSFGGGFSIGAMVTVPLWHWGGNYNRLRAARAQTTAQKLLLEDASEMVELQISQAKYRYQEAYKTYSMTRSNMASADENLRQAQLSFREGIGTINDVLAAHTAWLAAHSEKIDAEIGIKLCNVYLSKVLGQLKY